MSWVVFHWTEYDWYGRQHFPLMLARAFARRSRVLVISRPIPWPLSRGMRPRGRWIGGGYLASDGDVDVLQTVVPNGARLRRLRSWRRMVNGLVARAALRSLKELGAADRPALIWCGAPDCAPLLQRLEGAPSVYWCGDDHQHLDEEPLVAIVDRLLAISPPVYEDRVTQVDGRVSPAFMAVEPAPYEEARRLGAVPEDLAHLPRPWLGYGGALNWRLDFSLLRAVAEAGLGTLVLIGPTLDEIGRREVSSLLELPNVIWLGHRDAAAAPAYLAALDVGLLPYTPVRFNQNCNPTKFYEYLASGLPVASVPLPILEYYSDLVCTGDGPEGFVDAVRRALSPGQATDQEVARRQAVARNHSYDRLVELVMAEVAGSATDRSTRSRWGANPRWAP